LGLRGGYSL